MRETYRIGNAQSIGSYDIQSNYFSTIYGSDCLAVLADGTIDHINGRRGAILATEACMRAFPYIPKEADLSVFFDSVAAKILQDMRDIIFSGKMPRLSLSIQYIRNQKLFYYIAGSNRAFLFNGADYQLLTGKSGRVTFRKGMTAGLISSGVWEALNEKELISYLKRKEHPYDKAQRMLTGVKEKNRKRAGNATIVLVEGCL